MDLYYWERHNNMGRWEYASAWIKEKAIWNGCTKVVELGCNKPTRRISDCFIGIDVKKESLPDIVCNIEYGLPFKTNSIEAIVGIDIIEHIDGIHYLIKEMLRILINNGLMIFAIPRADIMGYKIQNICAYGHKKMYSKDDWSTLLNEYKNIKIERNENLPDKWFFIFEGRKI
jgi:predicted SAM-dependent methyltransferase